MRDLLSWNVSLGRWAGVQVRLHVFSCSSLFCPESCRSQRRAGVHRREPGHLLASVLAHEFGHCVAAWKTGGTASRSCCAVGGFRTSTSRRIRTTSFVTALAGPLVNLAICVLLLPLLFVIEPNPRQLWEVLILSRRRFRRSWRVMVGLREDGFLDELAVVVDQFVAGLPVGRRTRSAGIALAALRLPLAVQLVVVPRSSRPLRCGLQPVGLGIVLVRLTASRLDRSAVVFNAKQEAERIFDHDSGEGTFGYDFSQGYTSLERHYPSSRQREPGPFRKWLEVRKALVSNASNSAKRRTSGASMKSWRRLHETRPGWTVRGRSRPARPCECPLSQSPARIEPRRLRAPCRWARNQHLFSCEDRPTGAGHSR